MPLTPLIINVELSLTVVPTLNKSGNPEFEHSIAVKASNPGIHPITLEQVGICLPNKCSIVIIGNPPSVRLPYTLPEGKNCSSYISLKEFISATQKLNLRQDIEIYGYYRNDLGMTYISPAIKFDIIKWKNAPLGE